MKNIPVDQLFVIFMAGLTGLLCIIEDGILTHRIWKCKREHDDRNIKKYKVDWMVLSIYLAVDIYYFIDIFQRHLNSPDFSWMGRTVISSTGAAMIWFLIRDNRIDTDNNH